MADAGMASRVNEQVRSHSSHRLSPGNMLKKIRNYVYEQDGQHEFTVAFGKYGPTKETLRANGEVDTGMKGPLFALVDRKFISQFEGSIPTTTVPDHVSFVVQFGNDTIMEVSQMVELDSAFERTADSVSSILLPASVNLEYLVVDMPGSFSGHILFPGAMANCLGLFRKDPFRQLLSRLVPRWEQTRVRNLAPGKYQFVVNHGHTRTEVAPSGQAPTAAESQAYQAWNQQVENEEDNDIIDIIADVQAEEDKLKKSSVVPSMNTAKTSTEGNVAKSQEDQISKGHKDKLKELKTS